MAYLVSKKNESFVWPLPSTCAMIEIMFSRMRCESKRLNSNGFYI